MDYAVERKHVAHLPYPRTIRLRRDRGRPKQPAHIDNEFDLWRLADSIAPHWRAWVLTAGYLGLRPGECHGIRRTDLDLENGWLTVAGAVKEHGNKPPYYEPVTKDERAWIKPIPAFLVDILRDHLELFSFHETFVFATREGFLIRRRNFYRRWYKALERAELPRMTPHSLRHTCSTLLDAKGFSIKERMDYVGHSTVAMQLHYTHVGRDRLRDIAEVIDQDVRQTLGVVSFARDGRKMDAIRDLRKKKLDSADTEKGVSPGSLLSTEGG